jgi:DNA repair protein RecO (recombination protein O)
MPTPRVYKTEAIVLRHRRLGDADRILSLYTPLTGRIEAVAKGVLKPTSRMGGHLETLTHCSLLLAQGRTLDVVTQAQTLHGFPALRDDLQRLSAGLYLAELVDRFTDLGPSHGADGGIFALLLAVLGRLEEGDDIDLLCRFAELRILDALGYRPQLDSCVRCATPLSPRDHYFAAHSGGVLCADCIGQEAGPVRPLSLNALKTLRFMQSQPFAEAGRVRLTPALAAEVQGHLRELIHSSLDRDVRSAAFLDRVQRMGPRPADVVQPGTTSVT